MGPEPFWVWRTILPPCNTRWRDKKGTGMALIFQTRNVSQEIAIGLLHRMAGMLSSHGYIWISLSNYQDASCSFSFQFPFCNNGLNKGRKLLSEKKKKKRKIISLQKNQWKYLFLFLHALGELHMQRESKCHIAEPGVGSVANRLITIFHLGNTHPRYAPFLQPANQASSTW